MAKARSHVKFTVRDFMSLPESNKSHELLGGEIIMAPSPKPYHQEILKHLLWHLVAHVEKESRGEVYPSPLDVILTNEDVAQPDLLFVKSERLHIVKEDAIHGPPDLVVEVLSPSTAERDRSYKRTLYDRCGVQEYWIVDPDPKQIEVLALGESGYRSAGRFGAGDVLTSPLLSDFTLPLDSVF